jgi:hypothetical protein
VPATAAIARSGARQCLLDIDGGMFHNRFLLMGHVHGGEPPAPENNQGDILK